MKKMLLASAVSMCLLASAAIAADGPEFDRPGIGFATSTLAPGSMAWEQGLPDFSRASNGAWSTTSLVADSLFRLGLPRNFELQFGADSIGMQRTHGPGYSRRDSGLGDGWVSGKWAPELASRDWTLAVLGTATVPFGDAPIGDAGHNYDLGITAARALAGGTSVSLYANRGWGDSGRGWMVSPAFAFPVGPRAAAYVEAGVGTGALYTRVAGGGFTYMLRPHLQLDAWLLRGLNDQSPDWQGGFGVAWLIR